MRNIFILWAELGKKVKRICDPSKGGMGIKLNIASIKFIKIMKEKIEKRLKERRSRDSNMRAAIPKIKAIIKFDAGPAKATLKEPYF